MRENFLGLVSDFKRKVLSPAGYRALRPLSLHDVEKVWFLPLEELTVWGADTSQSKS